MLLDPPFTNCQTFSDPLSSMTYYGRPTARLICVSMCFFLCVFMCALFVYALFVYALFVYALFVYALFVYALFVYAYTNNNDLHDGKQISYDIHRSYTV